MLIDTHAHLNLDPLINSWKPIVSNAVRAGVTNIVVPGTNSQTSQLAVTLDDPHLHPAVGIHPEETAGNSKYNLTAELEAINALTKNSNVVAVGEIGLDYKSADSNQEAISLQRWLFREQLSLAKSCHLPVLVHIRRSQAFHDACDDIASVYGKTPFLGVFHCFTGTRTHYERIRALNGYIGVGGIITYAHNSSLNKLVRSIPLENILLETDAPWLTPLPNQDKVNQPAHTVLVALKLAEIFEVPSSIIMHQTTANALQLFQGKIA